MNKKISPLIEAEELLEFNNDNNLILVDASNGNDAEHRYRNCHLEGALFVSLKSDLADIKDDFSQGGRHPLPTIHRFATTLTRLGITANSHVVIYDDTGGANSAARFWWMLKSFGHAKVQVINGGLQQALKIGFPTSDRIEDAHVVANYEAAAWKLKTSTIDEVEDFSKNENTLIVDVRESSRFRGISEAIDLVAGHIPNAINIPYLENLDSNGKFLSVVELKHKYEEVFNGRQADSIIFHCGSGVTACHSLLAIDYAGLEIPKLYVGSWSEWSRNNKAIVKEV